MNRSKLTVNVLLAVSAMFVMAPAHSESVDKPAVERVEAPFPPQFNDAGNLFEEAPMAHFEEPMEYQIKRGEKLREAMTRWTEKSGYEFVWQPEPADGDIRFAADMSFTNSFEKASESFFEIVRAQTKFDGKVHSNKVLRVFVANAKR
ncbi:TcpQ domain-containing protein [Marinobacter salarius]|uniref:Toxin co-regulated pilus biosynthesis protein Q n=1 Tax=Marinobacter salarius TaxID=1420917 RepID=A0A1W6KG53_9GAMM|nr:TcpQ domain-containing protein [Marinobacter salarius]ARM86299.1 toxin co-regulated pilus biosynthesis protein Q [Marinobacter salarius]